MFWATIRLSGVEFGCRWSHECFPIDLECDSLNGVWHDAVPAEWRMTVTLYDRVVVTAPVDAVWQVLADPVSMTRWNPKCVRCDAGASRVQTGVRYKAAFRMSGPERESDCEVVTCEPHRLLVTRFSMDHSKPGGYVDETFRLEACKAGTQIVHEVDFTHSGLPLWLKAFMKLMDVVGRKAGTSSLDGIKSLVEQVHT